MGLLAHEREEPYFHELEARLDSEPGEIHPPREQIFQALEDVAPNDVRVVILGQDPYHGPGQALGRSFAVPNSLKPKPPSLLNVFKELESDLGSSLDQAVSDLSGWAAQGVLLLNTVLTVRSGSPLSHRGMGWERLTDRLLTILARLEQPKVFLLWGAEAQKKRSLIQTPTPQSSLILESVHPSPLSAYRGFFGCRHFSRSNDFLVSKCLPPIDWTRISRA